MRELIAQGDNVAVTGGDIVAMVSIVATMFVVTRLVRPTLRQLLQLLARRSLQGRPSAWQARAPRLFHESAETAELRRRQRINATATGFARLFSLLGWTVVVVIILELANIDPVFALSGAGFLGVAISIGGQHTVNDFLTGIHILLEDRFGEGDEVILQIGEIKTVATVASLGAMTTRFQSDTATLHVANRELTIVQNLSQRGTRTEIELRAPANLNCNSDRAGLESELRSRYASSQGYDPARDGLILDSVPIGELRRVAIRTARPVTAEQRRVLAGS